MPITIKVENVQDAEAETRSLLEWLVNERRLAGTHIDWVPAEIRRDEQGALSDAIVVALGGGGAGAVLAQSVATWLRTRHSDVRIRVRTRAGTLEIDGRRLHNPEMVMKEIAQFIGDDGGPT